MPKPSTRARGNADDRAARAARADDLIARLESQIARDAATRAVLLGSVATASLVEPHRDHHAYALGADQADCELATFDAGAMRGLMSIGPKRLADLLDKAAEHAPAFHVTRLWRGILDADRNTYRQRGAAVDAKRLAATGSVPSDQRTVFEAAVAQGGVGQIHRDQIAFTLGADLFYCGLTAHDTIAMLGLMSIGPVRLAAELRDVAGAAPVYVAKLWPELLMRHRDDYEARGHLVRWQRRWARYRTEFEAWLANPRRDEDDWRTKPMTARQRHLVRDTAIVTGSGIPEDMDCGAAHDWLMASGANALFRKEM